VNREHTVNLRRTVLPVLLAVALAAGCTASSDDDGRLSVVASTNVWGDVAAQVGGDLVDVTSIVSDPAADPHSYEGSARQQLDLSKADLVVVNGGGYDDFATIMLSGLDGPPPVVTAVDSSTAVDHADDDGAVNEHVWYDLPTVAAVADKIAAELSRIDPDHADTYAANAAAFTAEIATLTNRTQSLAQTVGGQAVAVTEPVPGYLLDALGLVDKTPPQFAEAVENETDVPATVMRDTLALFTDRQVVLLVYNAQTTGPQTEQVRAAADEAQIPVVAVTETLPPGQSYLTWMSGNLDALAQALGVTTPSTGTPSPDSTSTDPTSAP
jgi:zinc/manganese transport system substrate-binding protein